MTTPQTPALPDMGVPADEVIDALIAGIVRVSRRAEIYEANGTTPMNISDFNARLTGGEVSVDAFRDERRVCDLTLSNVDGALDLEPYNGFYYDKVIKVFWGIRYFDGTIPKVWETQIGEFMIDQITEEYFPNEVQITGRDYSKKCLQSKLTQSMSFSQY